MSENPSSYLDWIVLWARPSEINEVVLKCFEDLIGINILPGGSMQQLAVILDLRQKTRLHNNFMKPKDRDLAVMYQP